MPDLVSLPEAAQALGLPYLTAWNRCMTGQLPARKEGRAWRVDLVAARAQLAQAKRAQIARLEAELGVAH